MRRQAILGLTALLLCGCATRIKYQPPASVLAKTDRWSTPLPEGTTAEPAGDGTLARWWATLGDPLLTSLEERAMKGNLDLRKAEALIRQARAQRDAARGDLYPGISAGSSAMGSRSSTRAGSGEFGQAFTASLDASWEPDFFGRIHRSIEAYSADLGAAQEDLRNALVSLTAEVALSYIDVRSYQAQLAITRANLAAQQNTYELTMVQYESGLATELDTEQARLAMESTRASIPTLETALQKSANSVAVLLGERPGSLDEELADAKPVPIVPAEVAVGVPADLIRRRPDIRSAERKVAAQTARLGEASANLRPAFTITGPLTFNSTSFLNLLTPAALASSIAGSVQQTVLNRRRLREQINVQDAALEQAVVSYESTVLTALQDVEDALDAFANEQVRRRSLAEANVSAAKAVAMAQNYYAAGLRDFLTVLDAQRSQLALQLQLVQSDATIVANLIRLYKSLGGGWR
jgi:NodT family efflux transporter outer membrane factor (OMF) lipoprotein